MEKARTRSAGRKKLDPRGLAMVKSSGLPRLLAGYDAGEFGTTAVNLAVLEDIASALGLLLDAYDSAACEMTDEPETGSLDLPPLSAEQKKLAGLFALLVFCFYLSRRLSRILEPPEVEGGLSPEGLDALASQEPEKLAEKTLALLKGYLAEMEGGAGAEPLTSDGAAARCIYAFCSLLQHTVDEFSRKGRLGRLREKLASRRIRVGDEEWKGFMPYRLAAEGERPTLRPVMPEGVVGNREYLEACLRTARDVAGYDFESGRNPKRINPILFALGRPGCGKTLTAHAVGNYFMKYCADRGIPSRFTVIRRTDWASSYQNASAANLIKIFRDLHEFEGLFGVYWADIDTALASRSDRGMRAEEKANLSAAFNIFDGTLIPMDGKWFMMCDANNLDMDEALKSRVSQEPYYVKGPETAEDYVRLMRDILLREHREFVEADDDAWMEIGRSALEGDLSGRAMENISRQIITRIQDFEYPAEYFSASYEKKREIVGKHSVRVDAAFVTERIAAYIRFEKEDEVRLSKKRFDDAVEEVVFGLNVQREVFRRSGEGEEGKP